MPDIFERLGLRRLVNVSGTETPLGAAPVCSEVITAVSELIPFSVDMSELQSVACDIIARAVGVEAGCITGCTAASIAISIAATMTGCDVGRVEQLPDSNGMKNEVILQKGHEVTYGQNVSQNVRLTGARVVEIGAATQCGAYQLRAAITPQTTAALYVVSHLTVQNRLIDLKTFCEVCHETGVPVIVDAASMADPRPFAAAGADLVLFSAHKSFASLTAGIVAGKRELVQACVYQEHGIGRPMKVGKEGVVGAIAALERWMALDNDRQNAERDTRLQRAQTKLSAVKGVAVAREKNQLKLQVAAADAGITAWGLAQALRAENPSVVVWNQLAEAGILLLTLSKVSDATADYVCDRIRDICTGVNQVVADAPVPNLGDAIAAGLEKWPFTVCRGESSVARQVGPLGVEGRNTGLRSEATPRAMAAEHRTAS